MSDSSESQQHPADEREIEWQFACHGLDAVRRWIGEHDQVDGWSLEARDTLDLVDTYFDTGDWRIFRAGYALRLRSESGRWEATLKSLRSASAEVADRRELREPVTEPAEAWVHASRGPVGTRVLAVCGPVALEPLFEVRTRRQRFAVRKPEDAAPRGEIALDDSVLCRPAGGTVARLQRVEVEALTSDHEALRALATTLREGCALEPPEDNKFSLGLKSMGLQPVTTPGLAATSATAPATLTPAMADVARANLRRHLAGWLVHEPGARLGEDPEELHELRVAVRRVDALARDFRDSMPALAVLRASLKRTLRALGNVRDLDVALAGLDAFARDLPAADRPHVEPLRCLWLAGRDRAREAMLTLLDSAPVRNELQTLISLLEAPPDDATPPADAGLPAGGAASARREAPPLLRRRYRKVRRAAERLTVDGSAAAHHALRGEVKKLRYALEAVASLYGKPAVRLLRSLRRWQERLGVRQDAAVAAQRLQALAAAPPDGIPPPTLFLMGRLAEHHENAAAQARTLKVNKRRRLSRRWKRLLAEF